MKAVNILSPVLLAGLSVASLASGADAQSTRRYAAMERCIAQAQAQWPNTADNSNGRNRTAAYKSCMVAAGQRP
jgi:hypothetical protein